MLNLSGNVLNRVLEYVDSLELFLVLGSHSGLSDLLELVALHEIGCRNLHAGLVPHEVEHVQ